MYNKEYMKKYYDKNREKIKAYGKKYYEKNKDKIIIYNYAYIKANGCKYQKDYQRMRLYGMSIQDYQDMYTEQEGCCLICHRHYERLCINHCHAKGIVRGLLCYRCNIMLGHAHDDVSLLLSAIEYLNK